MGYEFEDVWFEIILSENDFPKLKQELEEIEGTAWMPEELYIEKYGYCVYWAYNERYSYTR